MTRIAELHSALCGLRKINGAECDSAIQAIRRQPCASHRSHAVSVFSTT